MGIEDIAYFAVGTASGFLTGSFVERPLHEQVLHCRDPKNFSRFKIINYLFGNFVKAASDGHHLQHHPKFKPGEHYYSDGTNQGVVSHFSKSDVGLIAGVSAFLGAAIPQTIFLDGSFDLSSKEVSFSAGFAIGAMGYYGLYESTHHLMHFLGERRSKIGYTLGDRVQGDKPDGNLRFSVPLMTELSNEMERNIDEFAGQLNNRPKRFIYKSTTIQQLRKEINYNRSKSKLKPYVRIEEGVEGELLRDVTNELIAQENIIIASLSRTEYARHKLKRFLSRQIRESPIFQGMERHHYMHHIADHTNLNVVLPLPDYCAKTKVDSSEKKLREKTNLWHLPNPLARAETFSLA